MFGELKDSGCSDRFSSASRAGAAARASTATAHHEAVAQVIPTMRKRFGEALSLDDMAAVAALSPCHFNRVFRKITGITPARFLCALRLRAAMQLLLTTQLSVTDVCFAVGYNSLGTFTSRFTKLIGLPPSQLRELADKTPPVVELLTGREEKGEGAAETGAGIHGTVTTGDSSITMIFVGLFPTAIPQGRPVACTLLTGSGAYRMREVPDGQYHVFAAGFPRAEDSTSLLLPDPELLQVGAGTDLPPIREGRLDDPVDIALRPIEVTDPPILSALPHLLLTRYSLKLTELSADPLFN